MALRVKCQICRQYTDSLKSHCEFCGNPLKADEAERAVDVVAARLAGRKPHDRDPQDRAKTALLLAAIGIAIPIVAPFAFKQAADARTVLAYRKQPQRLAVTAMAISGIVTVGAIVGLALWAIAVVSY